MDRATTIAWIQERAEDRQLLEAPAAGPVVAELARTSPTCGDQVRLRLHVGGPGVQLRGTVAGCGLSSAATAVAVRTLEHLGPAEAAAVITAAIDCRLLATVETVELADDLTILAELELVPLRRRCVAYPWQLIADLLAARI